MSAVADSVDGRRRSSTAVLSVLLEQVRDQTGQHPGDLFIAIAQGSEFLAGDVLTFARNAQLSRISLDEPRER
jgi:hypothetical protein